METPLVQESDSEFRASERTEHDPPSAPPRATSTVADQSVYQRLDQSSQDFASEQDWWSLW